MSFSNRTSQAILNSLFGKTSNFGTLSTRPTLHIALSTTAPAADGSNVTEPVGNNYARVATATSDWGTATLADPSTIANVNAVTFPQASGAWGTITHFAIYDASTSGNFIGHGTLPVPKAPTTNDTPAFGVGALVVSLT
jgi:hypothetical protein